MTIAQHIANFLRDSQYRIAQLSCDMDNISDEGSYKYQELYQKRLQLSVFMDVCYEGNWRIIGDDFNYIQYVDEAHTDQRCFWTEKEVLSEIDYLRYYTQMNEYPWITFTGHYPLILASSSSVSGGSGSGGSLPQGLYGQMIVYNLSNIPVAVDVDEYGGMLDGEPISSYFSGRP